MHHARRMLQVRHALAQRGRGPYLGSEARLWHHALHPPRCAGTQRPGTAPPGILGRMQRSESTLRQSLSAADAAAQRAAATGCLNHSICDNTQRINAAQAQD